MTKSYFSSKINAWLEQAKVEPHFEEERGYDPNAYSVAEWEEYLTKKNNNMNFEQFLTRRRWKIGDTVDLDDFRARLKEAADNSQEFLTQEEMEYAENLFVYLEQLAEMCSKEASENYYHIGPEYRTAVKVRSAATEQLKFCCYWKYISGQEIPDSVRDAISKAIAEQIGKRKQRWEWMRSQCPGRNLEAWNPEKNNLYKRAMHYGALLPVHINELKSPTSV